MTTTAATDDQEATVETRGVTHTQKSVNKERERRAKSGDKFGDDSYLDVEGTISSETSSSGKLTKQGRRAQRVKTQSDKTNKQIGNIERKIGASSGKTKERLKEKKRDMLAKLAIKFIKQRNKEMEANRKRVEKGQEPRPLTPPPKAIASMVGELDIAQGRTITPTGYVENLDVADQGLAQANVQPEGESAIAPEGTAGIVPEGDYEPPPGVSTPGSASTSTSASGTSSDRRPPPASSPTSSGPASTVSPAASSSRGPSGRRPGSRGGGGGGSVGGGGGGGGASSEAFTTLSSSLDGFIEPAHALSSSLTVFNETFGGGMDLNFPTEMSINFTGAKELQDALFNGVIGTLQKKLDQLKRKVDSMNTGAEPANTTIPDNPE